MTGGAQAACGKVTIADMNWPSATLMAHVDAMILKYGYGCDAELITGDTMPTGTSMIEKGEPDIAPELWTNSFAEALQKGIDEKRLRIAGKSLSDGGGRASGYRNTWSTKCRNSRPSPASSRETLSASKTLRSPASSAGPPVGTANLSGHLFSALQLATQDLWSTQAPPRASTDARKAYERKQLVRLLLGKPPSSANTRWLNRFGSGIDDSFKDCIRRQVQAPK